MDVVALAALFSHVTGLLEDPLANGREHGSDLAALARLYEELGRPDQAVTIYQEALACELTEPVLVETVRRLSFLQRRRGPGRGRGGPVARRRPGAGRPTPTRPWPSSLSTSCGSTARRWPAPRRRCGWWRRGRPARRRERGLAELAHRRAATGAQAAGPGGPIPIAQWRRFCVRGRRTGDPRDHTEAQRHRDAKRRGPGTELTRNRGGVRVICRGGSQTRPASPEGAAPYEHGASPRAVGGTGGQTHAEARRSSG